MTAWTYLLTVALSADPTQLPLLATLPEDGRWAKFDLRLQTPDQEQTLAWTVRSVGMFQQAGRDLRCLETELTGGTGNVPPSCHRMLTPIDAFGPDKHALGQTVRMWVRRGEAPIETFDSLSGDPLTALFLTGATENIRRLEKPETVMWQRGKLECDSFTGKSSQEIGASKFVMTWTILRHADIPFGLAGLRMNMSIDGQVDAIKVTLNLQDHGQDAKATLPQLVP